MCLNRAAGKRVGPVLLRLGGLTVFGFPDRPGNGLAGSRADEPLLIVTPYNFPGEVRVTVDQREGYIV
jgi:hypothetical protein